MKLNQVQHSFRLNLDNPDDAKIHRTLIELDKDVYKSKSRFIVNCLWDVVEGGRVYEVPPIKEISDELMEEIVDKVKKETMAELTKLLLSSIAYRPAVDMSMMSQGNALTSVEAANKKATEQFDPTLVAMADLYGGD